MTEPVCPAPPISWTFTRILGRTAAERTYTVRVVLDPLGIDTVIVRQFVPATQLASGTLALSGRNAARPVPVGGASAGWFATMNW